jgi:PAS domain S-box-containing protein
MLENAAFLSSLIHNSTDVITILKEDGTILFQSPSVERLFGYTENELVGTDAFLLIHPDDLPEVIDNLTRVINDPEHLLVTSFRVKHKDGGWRILESTGSNQLENPLIRGIVVNSRDITERSLAEEALRAREAQLSTLVESLPFELFGIGKDGRYFLQNEVCRKHWGDFIGKKPEEVANDQHTLDIWLDNNRRAFSGEIVKGEIELVIGDEKKYVYNIISPILSSGQVDGIVGFNIDVTERRHTEEELSKYREHLEELVMRRAEEISVLNKQLLQSQKLEAIGVLAGGVAHEFSNILATMKGAAYLIQKKLPHDSPAMKYADQIVSSIAKANSLSQELLSFSRQRTISLKPVHFNETIKKIVGLLCRLIGEHIELKLLLADSEATVMADANQIEQVLVNLTTNARDAMPYGGTLTIKTDVMEMHEEFIKENGYGVAGPYIVLTVSDTGVGMKEQVRANIFQPFFTTKPVGKGSGLGLAVTYGIIKQHNGFIDVESRPERGSTFRIYLPTVDVRAITGEQKGDTLKVKSGEETILLAEDDSDALTMTTELLKMTGYTVLVATDGEEAVKVFTANQNKVQLVIADVRMPKKDGQVVFEEIRKIAPAARFLFMSGYTADVIDSHGIIWNKDLEFISKGARPDEFLAKVRDVLDA